MDRYLDTWFTQIRIFQVLGVLDIIEPGLNRERSLVLKDLAATKKLILQRKLINKEISDDEFSIQIQECVNLFNEHQDCALMRFKKNEPAKDKIPTVSSTDNINEFNR